MKGNIEERAAALAQYIIENKATVRAAAAKFGVSFEKMFGKYLPMYIENGFMENVGRKYRFTPKGMFVSNYILSAMLDFDSDMIAGCADGSDR